MPNELDKFFHAFEYYDAGDAIIDNSKVQGVIDSARRFGLDTLESIRTYYNKKKQSLLKPPALTRTLSETAFLENDLTTLSEVTKPELKEQITFSNVLKDVSYGVQDFSVTARYNDRSHGHTYGVRFGDKIGIHFEKGGDIAYSYASLEHNLYNGRTRVDYSINNPVESYGISIYHDTGNIGCTLHYSNQNGLSAAISGDSKSISGSIGYSHQYTDCKLSVKGFVSSQRTRLDSFYNRETECKVGICGNVTF